MQASLLLRLRAFLRIVGGAFAVVALGAALSAQPRENAPRLVEALAFGRDIGELRLFQGRELGILQAVMMPTGETLALRDTSRIEFQRRVTAPDGAQGWAPVALAEPPNGAGDLTALLVPLPAPDERGSLFAVRWFGRSAQLPQGVYELSNLTPATLMVQVGGVQGPVEVAPWSQQVFRPQVDSKFRVPVRVAYRTASSQDWNLAKVGVVNLPPDQSLRARFIFAGGGLGALGEGAEELRRREPTLLLTETPVPVADRR
jgi:hypothetical protein